MTLYRHFILLMGSSPGFGSTNNDLIRALNARFHYGFAA